MWLDKKNPEDPYNRVKSGTGTPSVGAGGGGIEPGGGAGKAQAGSTAAPAPAIPQQNFASIQDYFKTNQQQGEQFGQQFTDKLANTAQQQKGAITGAVDSARNEITSKAPKENTYLTARAASDPWSVSRDKGLTDSFMSQWNATYAGPSSFEESESYSKGADAVQKANEKKEQLKSVGGRQQLVQDEFGVYGQGNRGLDEALLQTSSAFPKVQQQEKEFGGLQDYFKTKGAELAPTIADARTTADKTRQSTRAAVGSGLNKFVTDVDSNVQKTKDSVAAQTTSAQKALGDRQAVNASVLKSLGLTQNEFDKLHNEKGVAGQGWNAPGDKNNVVAAKGFNLADYFKANPLDVSRRTTVSQDDINKAKGYAALTQDQNILPTVGDTANPGSFLAFDKAKALKDMEGNNAAVRAAQKAYQDKNRPVIPPSKPGEGVLRSQPINSDPKPQVNPGVTPEPVVASPGYKLLPEVPGQPRQEVKEVPKGVMGTQPIRNVPSAEPTPQVNPGVNLTPDGKPNPNNIQYDPISKKPIIPEGSTGIYTPPGGSPTLIPDMKGVQTGNVINPNPTTVDTKGGTEKAPYIGDKVVKQINDAVALRTQVNNPDPTANPRLKAMGNDLASLYARKLGGTLSEPDKMQLNMLAHQLGLSELATSAVPTDLNAYLEQNKIAAPPKKTPEQQLEDQFTAARGRATNATGRKQVEGLITEYKKYAAKPRLSAGEAKNFQQIKNSLGIR